MPEWCGVFWSGLFSRSVLSVSFFIQVNQYFEYMHLICVLAQQPLQIAQKLLYMTDPNNQYLEELGFSVASNSQPDDPPANNQHITRVGNTAYFHSNHPVDRASANIQRDQNIYNYGQVMYQSPNPNQLIINRQAHQNFGMAAQASTSSLYDNNRPQTPQIVNRQALQGSQIQQENNTDVVYIPVSSPALNRPASTLIPDSGRVVPPHQPSRNVFVQQTDMRPVQKPQSSIVFSTLTDGNKSLRVTNATNQQPQRQSYIQQQIVSQPQIIRGSAVETIKSVSPSHNVIVAPNVGVQQSVIINRQDGRSLSVGSAGSRVSRPQVTFSYSGRLVPGSQVVPNPQPQPLPLSQPQVQVIREHTHTVVEKTVTVVWQHRYLTVIEKFNYMYEKWQKIFHEITIITQILERAQASNNLESSFRDLMMRHTMLLQMLTETQHQLHGFVQENQEYRKQIENETEIKQYREIRERVIRLQQEKNQLIQQIERLRNTRPASNSNEELIKLQTLNQKLQTYIKKLQVDNNSLITQLKNYKSAKNNDNEYTNLIKSQESIIRQLQQTLNQKQSPNPQLTVIIQQLQARIAELERTEQGGSSQFSERKYTEIIETQSNIIQNLETHLREFTHSSEVRENELRVSIQEHSETIRVLEGELRKLRVESKNNNSNFEIVNLQAQITLYQQNITKIQETLNLRISEIHSLRLQKQNYERIIQELSNSRNETRPAINNTKELQQAQEEIQRLTIELRKRQQDRRKLQEEMVNSQEQLKRTVMEKQSQLRLLNDRVVLLEEEIRRKNQEKDRRIISLEEQVESLNLKLRNNSLSTPNKGIFDSFSPSKDNSAELRSLRDRVSSLEQQLADIQRQKDNLSIKYQNLLTNYNNLEQESSRKYQQYTTLKRQISGYVTLESEIKTLNETISKKNQEILELKSTSFERNELRVQIQSIKVERTSLKTAIQTKNQEIDRLKQTINQLQAKIKQSKKRQNLFPNTNQSAAEQLQLLYETVKKKEAEINKLKQGNQLLEVNIQELEYELERAKGKVQGLEKSINHDKQQAQDKVREYEARMKEAQLKLRDMEETLKQSRAKLQTEIDNLELSVREKDENIRKLQGELKVLKNKLKNHDSRVQEADQQRQSLNAKIRQLQSTREQLRRQIRSLEQASHTGNKKMHDTSQVRIVQLQSTIKLRDNKIRELENLMETLRIKASHNNQTEDDFINQQQIEVLRKKLAEYETRIYNQATSKNTSYRARDYEGTYVFEQKVIYDLKAENQRLKMMLSGKGLRYSQSGPTSPRTNMNYLQKRLFEFNEKLEEIIEQNQELETKNADFEKFIGPKSTVNQQILNSFQRERAVLIRRHRAQISILQERLVDLQRYCSSLQFHQGNSLQINKTTLVQQNKSVYSEQLSYYRTMNKQLEDRIDNHIKLNKQLKEKLEGMQRSGADGNTIEYYKLQITHLEKEIAEYLNKIKVLSEQNKKLQKSLQDIRNDTSSQSTIAELENRIHELNRKLSQLQMQNGILEADLSRYTQEIKTASSESTKLKSLLSQSDRKVSSLEQALREANNKISSFQTQNAKYLNQIKILESEIERLSEKLQQGQAQQNSQISRLKSRMAQLQNQIREHEQHAISWNESKLTYEQTIATLSNRISLLESEIARINGLFDGINRKIKDGDDELYTLQQQLRTERSRASELQALLRSKQAELQSLLELVQRMKRQRDNEGANSKQRLTYITELEETVRQLKMEVSRQATQITAQEQTIQHYVHVMASMEYHLEYIRSVLVEVGVLRGELRVEEGDDRARGVLGRIGEGVDAGLKACGDLGALL